MVMGTKELAVCIYVPISLACLDICGGLALADCQAPTQPLSHSLSSAGQGEKIRWKSLWVKVRTGRPLTSCHHALVWDLLWAAAWISALMCPWAAWIHAESTFSSSFSDLVSHFSPSHRSCCTVLFTLLKMLSWR